MKKIQIGTVRQTADVEVLFINASLIAKAIHANDAIQDIIEHANAMGSIVPRYQPKLDENGNHFENEYGDVVQEPVLDENGNHVTDYSESVINGYNLMKINTQVATFLKELVDAFEV